jgi:threonine aldolase
VGIIAAGALFALRHHRARLVEDHHRALQLWEGLREAGWSADRPETNMVYVKTENAPVMVERLGAAGIRCFALSPERIRLVTHLDVDDVGIRRAVEVFRGLRD